MKHYSNEIVNTEDHQVYKQEVDARFRKLTRMIVMVAVVAGTALIVAFATLIHFSNLIR